MCFSLSFVLFILEKIIVVLLEWFWVVMFRFSRF